MAVADDKQSLVAVENADYMRNGVDLAVTSFSGSGVLDETTDVASEIATVTGAQDDDVLTQADDQSCERAENDGQSNSSDVANTVKVKSQRPKRTGVRELVASVDMEARVKRRRVQHNYRRLSSAGYVDDYDGRERFSAEQTTTASGNRLSPSKSKSVDSPAGPTMSRHCASTTRETTTRSRSELSAKDMNTVRGQNVFEFHSKEYLLAEYNC